MNKRFFAYKLYEFRSFGVMIDYCEKPYHVGLYLYKWAVGISFGVKNG
jgi:hypothetical protein